CGARWRGRPEQAVGRLRADGTCRLRLRIRCKAASGGRRDLQLRKRLTMTTFLHVALANLAVATVLAVLAVLAGRFSRRPAVVQRLGRRVRPRLTPPPLVPLRITPWPERPAAEESEPVVDRQSEVGASAAAPPIRPAPVSPTTGVSPVTVLYEVSPGVLVEPRTNQVVNDPVQLVAPQPMPAQPLPPTDMISGFGAAAPAVEPSPEPTEEQANASAPTPVAWWSGDNLLLLAAWLWVAGAAAWFAWTAVCLLRFARMLRCAVRAPAELQAEARELA